MSLDKFFTDSLANQQRIITLLESIAAGNTGASAAVEPKADAPTNTPTKTRATRGKAKEEQAAPTVTVAQARDAAMALKDALGIDKVKPILAKHITGSGKLADMKPEQAEAIYNACLAAMPGDDVGEEEGEDDDM